MPVVASQESSDEPYEPTARTVFGSAGGAAVVRETETVRPVEDSRPATAPADQVRQHVEAHLARLRESGRIEVQMILHPPELGHVKLHLALDDGQLSVRFLVHNDNARATLDQQLDPMRARFSEMGFSLGQFDVRREGTSSGWQTPLDAETIPGIAPTAPRENRVAESTPSSAIVDVLA
jgi:flagellar hook-length control protein FliK